jgi:hypothetical protein
MGTLTVLKKLTNIVTIFFTRDLTLYHTCVQVEVGTGLRLEMAPQQRVETSWTLNALAIKQPKPSTRFGSCLVSPKPEEGHLKTCMPPLYESTCLPSPPEEGLQLYVR